MFFDSLPSPLRDMVLLALLSRERGSNFLCGFRKGYNYQQKFTLVNVKLKWVKDRALDAVVTGQRELRATCNLISILSSTPHSCLPIYRLTPHRGQLGLPLDLKLSTFIRRYPTIFHESHILDSGGTRVPCFHLTPEVLNIHREEVCIIEQNQTDVIERLCKLLMLTRDGLLPLQTIDQLKWDIGLPYDYSDALFAHKPDLFSSVCLLDGRTDLRLRVWNDSLAVSQLQKNSGIQQIDVKDNCLAFPVRFTRGFGLKRKCMKWLEEWQRLPYTSPYCNASHLDPRTDVSEKRIVGVFHELLHLTIQKKTERKNVSNLRTPLSLPQKFTKVFERHPGIFYISMKCDTQTVVLREAYDGQQLLQKHPLVEIREKYASLIERGFLDRSKGLYKEQRAVSPEDLSDTGYGNEPNGYGSSPNEELDSKVHSQRDSNDQACNPC